MGYEDAAIKIQEAFLAGRRQEAAAAVPDSLIDETALVGPPDRIRRPAAGVAGRSQGAPDRHYVTGGASSEALRVIAAAVL